MLTPEQIDWLVLIVGFMALLCLIQAAIWLHDNANRVRAFFARLRRRFSRRRHGFQSLPDLLRRQRIPRRYRRTVEGDLSPCPGKIATASPKRTAAR